MEPTKTRKPTVKLPFHMIIRVVVVLYLMWVGVMISDLIVCRLKGVGTCESQVNEVKGVFTTVTVGLMGWVSDSPMR